MTLGVRSFTLEGLRSSIPGAVGRDRQSGGPLPAGPPHFIGFESDIYSETRTLPINNLASILQGSNLPDFEDVESWESNIHKCVQGDCPLPTLGIRGSAVARADGNVSVGASSLARPVTCGPQLACLRQRWKSDRCHVAVRGKSITVTGQHRNQAGGLSQRIPPPPHPPLTYLHRILSCILDVVFVSFKGPDDVGPELGHDLEETPKRGNQPSCDLLFPRIVFGCSFQCDPGTWKTALKQIWPNKSF